MKLFGMEHIKLGEKKVIKLDLKYPNRMDDYSSFYDFLDVKRMFRNSTREVFNLILDNVTFILEYEGYIFEADERYVLREFDYSHEWMKYIILKHPKTAPYYKKIVQMAKEDILEDRQSFEYEIQKLDNKLKRLNELENVKNSPNNQQQKKIRKC